MKGATPPRLVFLPKRCCRELPPSHTLQSRAVKERRSYFRSCAAVILVCFEKPIKESSGSVLFGLLASAVQIRSTTLLDLVLERAIGGTVLVG